MAQSQAVHTWTKIRQSGNWGVRSTVPVNAGDVVNVEKQDGTVKPVVLERTVWSGGGVTISEIQPARKDKSSSEGLRKALNRGRKARANGRCRECGQSCADAPHHRAMGSLCGNCAFDEYDC
jgi:hypothetical protein